MQKPETIERLSARLDKNSQKKVKYLFDVGYGPTDVVKQGIDLLYKKMIDVQLPSVPALLQTLSQSEGHGPSDLSSNHKKYYRDLLIEKRTG